MKNKRFLTMVSMVCLIAGLAGCNPVTPPPTELPPTQPPPPELKTDLDGFSCSELEPPDQQESASNGLFMDDQVILTGPKELLVTVAEENKLELIQLCTLSYVSDDQAMGLYSTLQTLQTPDVLRNSINENPDYQAWGVVADLNYLISPRQGTGSCADPYSDGGSPNGDPYRNAPADQLLNQWAFDRIGLTYVPPTTWNDVHVGVFDTAPASLVPGNIGMSQEETRTLPWPNGENNDMNFYLKVSDILGQMRITVPKTKPTDFSDHGLFVAGLIRAVAPDSLIHLIRVLNDHGCGDSFLLSRAIHSFMAHMRANGINKVVINLSLGASQLNNSSHLESTLRTAYKYGAVIVAAAGNDSARLSVPAAMQLPATYNFVIGVAASNQDGIRSCYSNMGDVAAPGGNGGSGQRAGENCIPRANSWNVDPRPCPNMDMAHCDYGLISLVKKISPTAGQVEYGYGFWSGTSFSTPLVTGLAALAYKRSSVNQEKVYCLIKNGALHQTGSPTPDPLGAGIININNSLNSTACP